MKKTQLLLIIIHITGWLLFLCIPVFFLSQNHSPDYTGLSLRIFLFCFYYIAFFYSNTQQLIPSLYLKKKAVMYFAVIGALLIVTIFLKPFDRLIANGRPGDRDTERTSIFRPPPDDGRRNLKPPPGGPVGNAFEHGPRGGRMVFDIVSIVLFLLVWAVGFSLELVTLWKNTETRVAHAEAERAKAELTFLKARINPHFLFNTLNNIYSMALIQHEHTAASIMKLSNIMRYITDDIVNDFVPLENELQCIENYISLQQLRLNKNTPVNYSVSGDAGNGVIAPLLLMPFIENVFKYGVSNHQLSPIVIKIEHTGKTLHFYASNRIVPLQFSSERSGIGLSDTRQRLALLYPNRHHLNIHSAEDQFVVELTLHTESS